MEDVAGPHALNANTQRWFAISGLAALPLMFIGLLLARVLPAHNATWSAEHIVSIYSSNPDRIQLGCLLMMIGFAFWGWWTAVISMWVWRMESRQYPILTFATLILTAINTMVVELMALAYAVTAFRAGEVSPQITLTLNDVSWFLYYYTWPPYVLWLVVVAIAILRDGNVPTVFPRWLGWLTLAQAVVILPNAVQTFTFALTGPFAWNGFVTNYCVATFHGVWTISIAYCVFRTIGREERRLTPSAVAVDKPARA